MQDEEKNESFIFDEILKTNEKLTQELDEHKKSLEKFKSDFFQAECKLHEATEDLKKRDTSIKQLNSKLQESKDIVETFKMKIQELEVFKWSSIRLGAEAKELKRKLQNSAQEIESLKCINNQLMFVLKDCKPQEFKQLDLNSIEGNSNAASPKMRSQRYKQDYPALGN